MADPIVAAIISALVSTIVSYILFKFYYRKRLDYSRLINLSSIVQIEKSLGDDELCKAFRFHGITPQEIDNAGVTPKELAYLVANFTAGRIYDVSTYTMDVKPFEDWNYRYKLLKQESTRNAWDLIKRMMTEDDYIKKLQATKDLIDSVE